MRETEKQVIGKHDYVPPYHAPARLRPHSIPGPIHPNPRINFDLLSENLYLDKINHFCDASLVMFVI